MSKKRKKNNLQKLKENDFITKKENIAKKYEVPIQAASATVSAPAAARGGGGGGISFSVPTFIIWDCI